MSLFDDIANTFSGGVSTLNSALATWQNTQTNTWNPQCTTNAAGPSTNSLISGTWDLNPTFSPTINVDTKSLIIPLAAIAALLVLK